MGENFVKVWQSDHCLSTLKKMIFRSVLEEIIVRTNPGKNTLLYSSPFTGKVVFTPSLKWIVLARRRKRQLRWTRWKSSGGWRCATAMTRLPRC
jgi:hypothetical protein